MRRTSQGFTIVEMLVTAGLLTGVLAGLLLAFSTGGTTVRRGMEILDVVATTGLALEHLKRDLRGLDDSLPQPTYSSPDEMELSLRRFEGRDLATLQPRWTDIKYHFWVPPDRRQAVLEREEGGHRTRLIFDREVSLEIGSDASALRPERSVQVTVSFPPSRTSPSRRPRVRTAVTPLRRLAPTDSGPPPPSPTAGPGGPWSSDGTAQLIPLDKLLGSEPSSSDPGPGGRIPSATGAVAAPARPAVRAGGRRPMIIGRPRARILEVRDLPAGL